MNKKALQISFVLLVVLLSSVQCAVLAYRYLPTVTLVRNHLLDCKKVPTNFDHLLRYADQGNSSAQYRVGMLYLQDQDRSEFKGREAFRWFKTAAENNDVPAMQMMALLYSRKSEIIEVEYLNYVADSAGLKIDSNEAKKWENLAKNQKQHSMDVPPNILKYFCQSDYKIDQCKNLIRISGSSAFYPRELFFNAWTKNVVKDCGLKNPNLNVKYCSKPEEWDCKFPNKIEH